MPFCIHSSFHCVYSCISELCFCTTIKRHCYAQIYLCELCVALSGQINLYHTILVSHNHYAYNTPRLLCCLMLQAAVMALLRYFQATASLPTAKETALGDTVTQSPNAAVLHEVQAEQLRKRKPCTVFTAEQKATIGKYASEHGNTSAVKKFMANIKGGQLRESTIRLFCYQ